MIISIDAEKAFDKIQHLFMIQFSSVAQSCPTLCNPVDCSLPGSSVHWIFQAIVLEWIAISFSRGSSQPRDWTQVSRIVDRRFTVWATREVQNRQPTKSYCKHGELYSIFMQASHWKIINNYLGIRGTWKNFWLIVNTQIKSPTETFSNPLVLIIETNQWLPCLFTYISRT